MPPPGVLRALPVLLALAAPLPAAAELPAPARAGAASFVPAPCPFAEPTRPVECGLLDVPEDWARPEAGPRLSLEVRILRAGGPAGLAPVVYLSGGPGQDMAFSTAAEMEAWFAYLDGAMRWAEGRDVILLAQRGLAVEGRGMACPELGDPRVFLGASEDPDVLTDWVENVRQADRTCRERLRAEGWDLAAYSTRQSAEDVAALRRALGIRDWVLFGVSYGTRLGLTVLRDAPEGVAAAVFDSVFPPEVTEHWHDPQPFADALYMMLRGCALSRRCNGAFPDLEARLDRLLARLAAEPMPFWVDDPTGANPRLHFLLDDVVLLDMIFFDLYWVEDIAKIPLAIDALDRGDLDLFRERMAAEFVYDTLFHNWSWGMQSAINCNDDSAFYDEARLRAAMAAHPRLARWLATALELPPCEGWPRQARDSGATAPARSDVPVLMLAGEYDPVTPPAYADRALRHLSRGRLLVVPGVAHSVLDAADCAVEVVRAFLADPGAPLRRDCERRRPGIAWELR